MIEETKLAWREEKVGGTLTRVADAPPNEHHTEIATYRVYFLSDPKNRSRRFWCLFWNGIPMCEQPDLDGCKRYAELHYSGEWTNQDAVREAEL